MEELLQQMQQQIQQQMQQKFQQLEQRITQTDHRNEVQFQNIHASIKKTEVQVGQLAEAQQRMEQGKFPSYTEQAKAMTILRNGDRKSTRLNSSHRIASRMPSSA